MSNHSIIGSIGLKSNLAIERCSKRIKPKCDNTPVEQLGYNKAQCKRLADIKEELRQFSTTC